MTAPQPDILSTGTVPRHIAIIMDGNGRWAKQKHKPRVFGHKSGAEAVRRTVRTAAELGVEYLTLYAFSSENWKRPADEVDDLMGLLRLYIREEVSELLKNNIRLRFIGCKEGLAADIVAMTNEAEERTAGNDGLTLVIALNYGSQAEITRACRDLAKAVAAGEIDPELIDEDAISRALYTANIPDPDLLIRTSGEQRLSNFLLWQAAYSELVFTDVLWPDFGKESLLDAISEYQRRDRRFGARS